MASDIFVDPSVTDPVIKVGGICYYRQEESGQPVNVDEIDEGYDSCDECVPAPCTCLQTSNAPITAHFLAGSVTSTPVGGGISHVIAWPAQDLPMSTLGSGTCSYDHHSTDPPVTYPPNFKLSVDGVDGITGVGPSLQPSFIVAEPSGEDVCAWVVTIDWGPSGGGSGGQIILAKFTGNEVTGTYNLVQLPDYNVSFTYSSISNAFCTFTRP
jgi:hypothetical protein